MKHTFLLACLLLVALPAATFAVGEKHYPEYNFAITPPNDWQDTTANGGQKGVVASFGSPDQTRTVFVLVEERAVPAGELDDRFAAEFDRAAEPQLGKRLSGKFVVVQGIKSYERTSAPLVAGKTISLISRTTLVGTRFYSIQGYHFTGGDAGEDSQIRDMLDSFHFLTPSPGANIATTATTSQPAPALAGELPAPPPPVISITAAQATPAPLAERPPAPVANPAPDTREKDLEVAFQRGQDIGKMITVLLIVGVPILVIIWLVRRGKRRGPGVPPPSRPRPPQPSAAPKASRPPSALAGSPLPRHAASPSVAPAALSSPRSAPLAPPTQPVSPPTVPAAPLAASPAPPPAPPEASPTSPAAPAPESAPPTASPAPPAGPPPPLPTKEPPPPFVIRPRQRHMRG